jgi:transmembrane sensor
MSENSNIANEEFYFELIAKEVSGEISEQEKFNLHEWVDKAEENRLVYEQAVKSWKATAVKNKTPEFNVETAWLNVKAGTNAAKNATKEKVISNTILPMASKIAGTILVLIGILVLLKYTLFNTPEALNFSTLGNEIEIYLPDSSKVWLNKNSRLTYYSDYNLEERKVYLEGEAFFDVKKSPDKKFIVVGLRSISTVLGTSFTVRSVKKEPKEIVQVLTGSVSFAINFEKENEQKKDEIILLPGFKGELDRSSHLTSSKIKDPNFAAWKEKRLVFDNTSMLQVTEALTKYFNKEIKISNPLLLNCRFTGTFERPTEKEVLEVLTVSTNSSYQITDNKIILLGKGCSEK